MKKKMKQILQLFFSIFLIFGCSFFENRKQVPIVSLDSYKNNFISTEEDSLYIVPDFPKFNFYNWNDIISPLVEDMINIKNIKKGGVLLIDSVKKGNSINIPTDRLVNTLFDLINKKKIFNLISLDIVNNVRKILGFSYKDNLVSKDKTIGLARYINTDYFIYLVLSEEYSKKKIEIQLIDTKFGEIIWCGNTYFE